MNYDPLETCPYDPVHRILRSRMQYHLIRCSKNFPSSKKKQCPFDTCHLIDPVEFNHHINNCPTREVVVHYKIQEPENQNQLNLVKIEPHVMVNSEESWENDTAVETYNPLKNIEQRSVVRCLIGASKSEKKKFLMEERRRLRKLENDQHNQINCEKTGAKSKNNTEKNLEQSKNNYKSTVDSIDVSDHIEQEYKPLRPPKNLLPDKLSTIKSNTKDQSHKSVMEENNTSERLFQQILNTVTSSTNDTLTQKSSVNIEKDSDLGSKRKPFRSYAAILNKHLEKNAENGNNDIIDNKNENCEMKDNLIAEQTSDKENAFEKLSKTVEKIVIEDEGYKKKTEPLNKQIQLLKMDPTDKNSMYHKTDLKLNKKISRCAAKFSNDK